MSPCCCSLTGIMLGLAAFSLHHHSQCTLSLPSFPILSSCPQPCGAKCQGKVGKGRKGMEVRGTARGCWAAGSDGEVQLPLLFLRHLLTWLNIVVLDEAIIILTLQVGSTRHRVVLGGPLA